MTTTFNDLQFNPHPLEPDGVRARMFFPNGYGASVIKTSFSYGGKNGLYELAVVRGTEDDWHLCYSNPITDADDVLGHLTPGDVTAYLNEIAALPQEVQS